MKKPTLIERLRDSARHYRQYMDHWREIFPGRSVERHVYLLEEAADELAVKADGANAEAWQRTLDHANSLAAVARTERDEARKERDDARTLVGNHSFVAAANHDKCVTMAHERDEARKERDEARTWAAMSMYNKAIDERNRAETRATKAEKELRDMTATLSFVDGQWVRTS